MRALLVAAVFAVAAPGPAAGAGLSLASRDLHGSAPVRVPHFDLVGLHWRGSGSVLFRTRALDGRWSVWHAAAPESDDRPDRGKERSAAMAGWQLGSPYWTGGAEKLQYRTVGKVSRVRAYFVRSPGASRPVHTRIPYLANKPTIITRAQWGANEAIRRAAPSYADNVHFAIVHHTAGSNSYTASQSAAIVRAIEVYHVKANGWNDIGYNFLVDKYGQIFEGRYGGIDKPVVGAHAQGFNTGSVGIAVIGDYGSSRIGDAARRALVRLLAWRLDVAHVDPLSTLTWLSGGNPRFPVGVPVFLRAISGHRDTGFTDCPGNALYAQLPEIAREVSLTGGPKLYAPEVTGKLGGPVRFRATLSGETPWTVTVANQTGTVATQSGTGPTLDWTWDSSAAPGGTYTWAIGGPSLRGAGGSLGTRAAAALAFRDAAATPAVVAPGGDPADDSAAITYTLTRVATVTATLVGPAGTVGTIFSGVQSAGAQTLTFVPSAGQRQGAS